MDARKYGSSDQINAVSPSHFDGKQRTRLEAFTAAKSLKPNADIYDQLAVAKYIERGE